MKSESFESEVNLRKYSLNNRRRLMNNFSIPTKPSKNIMVRGRLEAGLVGNKITITIGVDLHSKNSGHDLRI